MKEPPNKGLRTEEVIQFSATAKKTDAATVIFAALFIAFFWLASRDPDAERKAVLAGKVTNWLFALFGKDSPQLRL